MTQDFLDVPDRTTVEKQLCRGGVPKQMRADRFGNAGTLAIVRESPPDIRPLEAVSSVLTHEHSGLTIGSQFQIFADPIQRSFREKHHTLFVSLADDFGLTVVKIDCRPV